MNHIRFLSVCAALLAFGCNPSSSTAQHVDQLKHGFEEPPNSARPRVWWHWMNGNITKEGIRLDLEWMHRVGIGGFQNFDAALGTPQVVDTRLDFMSSPWKDAFRYATRLADQLGLEEAIAGSPGWSETGGPWVPPSEAMKKYVWSETVADASGAFQGMLQPLPIATGPFQDLESPDPFISNTGLDTKRPPDRHFHAAGKVIAFRVSPREATSQTLDPILVSSGGSQDEKLLIDGSLTTSVRLPMPPEGKQSWIEYRFPKPQDISAVTFAQIRQSAVETGGAGPGVKVLEASDDGTLYRRIVEIPDNGAVEHTLSFPAVRARFFRLTFLRLKSSQPPKVVAHPSNDYLVAEFQLHPEMRVERFEEKAAFVPFPELYHYPTPAAPPGDVIRKTDVVDLTEKVGVDGVLNWTPPSGSWRVVRFGYSLLGVVNHPASFEATGLEVDKLDHTYVRHYLDQYLDQYTSAVGQQFVGNRGIRFMITDSWEAGAQNWTDKMLEQFQRLRGYDPLPWLPVLTGRVVESSQASDRFLWDFRKTISDLTANEHYGQIAASLHDRGMGHYGESHEGGRAFIGDGMEVKKLDEIPMSAMWANSDPEKTPFVYSADVRESASVAHLYGQNLVAAESFTTGAKPWAWSPATLKATADQELAEGVNRFVIHCSVHQPLLGIGPGLGLGPYGQWFTRNETWAEKAGPWVDYLARSSFMLQQGRFAADLLYFYGEDTNLTSLFAGSSPPIPPGYNFDYVNADALTHLLTVTHGKIAAPSGMQYRALVLDPNSVRMTLPVLLSLRRLVEAGAVVIGPQASESPSLADDDKIFNETRRYLWPVKEGVASVGKGKTYTGVTLVQALQSENILPDATFTSADANPGAASAIHFVHRTFDDGDLYFLNLRSVHAAQVVASFRVSGRRPELWRAETGRSRPVSFTMKGGRTLIPLDLEPEDAIFIVFRKPTTLRLWTAIPSIESAGTSLPGPWTVTFPSGRGAPPHIVLDKLRSWSEHTLEGVRYFSGTASYDTSFTAPPRRTSQLVWLDLGDVRNMAEVFVNGHPCGLVWHAPFRVNISAALRPGKNTLRVEVTNSWVNRLIGDQQPSQPKKVTFTVYHPYHANSPLEPSGLLGPVRLVFVTNK